MLAQRQREAHKLILEGAKILAEGKALRASDNDIVWVNDYGWPAYRGSPMFYAATIGRGTVRARLNAFRATLGADFAPASLLVRCVAEGRGLASV